MSVTIVSTPGASNANSYEEVAEANAYFTTRLFLNPAWDTAEDAAALLVWGTRLLDAMFVGRKILRIDGTNKYYVTLRKWTGAPATTTQRLSWPRTGMFDRNGNAIASNVIPQDLKDALSELAGQLLAGDRTLDNDVSVQGVKSVKAGSVAISFKDMILAQVIPDAVLNLMPASWFTDELVEAAPPALFDVL